jgi:hypothetical protein
VPAQEKFWHDASARLGRLFRLSDRDLDEIEALLMSACRARCRSPLTSGKVKIAAE